jgi:hypothetical protein
MILNTIFTIILIATIIVVILRYGAQYLWRRDDLRQKLSYMNDKLRSSEDIKTTNLSLLKFSKKTFLIENDYATIEEFLKNNTYKRISEEYKYLEEFKGKFWRLEGIIYLIIITIASLFLMI